MSTKKKIIIIVSSIIVLAGLIVWFLMISENNKKIVSQNEIKPVDEDTISRQALIDEEIKGYINDKSYTLDNPKILVNPYEIAPLSALIIFQTKEKLSYDVYVNDIKLTTVEESKKHSIPIYGLKSGEKNKVTLVDQKENKKEYQITTENIAFKLNVEKNEGILDNDFYFVSGPMSLSYGAFDKNGNAVWFIASDNSSDLEFLSNGHVLIMSDDKSESGFFEIDYLGKIYKKYRLEHDYHHEVNELKNGNLLVLGTKTSPEGYVSIIDSENGKEIKSIDVYELLREVDADLIGKYARSGLAINSAYLDENTQELILSIKNLNAVVSINFDNNKINWIIGDSSELSSNFDSYLLKPSDNSRLIKGQHTAFINDKGQLGLFNNDYNIHKTYFSIGKYKNNYSSAVYYDLDLSNRTYKTAWEYTSPKKEWNYVMGNFTDKGDYKIINFGWCFTEEAYKKNVSIYEEFGTTYSRIIELDQDDNIRFNATLDGSAYRVSKGKLYNDTIKNYEPGEYKLIDTTPYTLLDEVSVSSIKNNLDNAQNGEFDIEVTKTSVHINMIFDVLEDVKILFVGEDGKAHIYDYKPANVSTSAKMNLNLKGKYAIYVKVDDLYYNLNKSVDFGV